MSLPRTLGVIVGLALVTSVANAKDEKIPTLGGSKAIRAIVGSTIIISPGPNGPSMIYVGRDHTFRVINKKGEISSGEWLEKNHLFCIKHENSCDTVTVTGTSGFLTGPSRTKPAMFKIKAGNQIGSLAFDETCAPVMDAVRKQSAVPIYGFTITNTKDWKETKFVKSQTDIFVAKENGRWRRKPRSREERDQSLARLSVQMNGCGFGASDPVKNIGATAYKGKLDTNLTSEWWIGEADGLPLRQEMTLPSGDIMVTEWNYDHVAAPGNDEIDPE